MTIQISSLSKSYASQQVLDQLQLEITRGEIFSLVGVNGAGKTTLIKCMLNFHPADHGQILIDGKDSSETSSRQNLVYLPERFLPPHYMNGAQFFDYIFRLHKTTIEQAKIDQMLISLDLDQSILNKPVRDFSKGMAQKLGLAASLLLEKNLYLFDEPMSGLDPKARALVKQQLKQAREKGHTVFFSSHMLADVEELSDRIGILHNGKIVFCDTIDACKQQFNATTLEQAFLNCIA